MNPLFMICAFLVFAGGFLATYGTRPSRRRQGVFFVVAGLAFALGEALKGGAL